MRPHLDRMPPRVVLIGSEPNEVLMPELIRLFMGRRIECAQCHNHPFEDWTQNQFWGLAAFFAGYTELRDYALIIDVLGGGHVDQPKEMTVINPRTKAASGVSGEAKPGFVSLK